jgi:hypothetical protein
VGPSCQGEGAAREGGRQVADGRGQAVSGVRGVRSWAAWAGRGEGKRGRAELGGPDSAQPRGGFSFSFLFLISNSFLLFFLFLFLFVSLSFESKNSLNDLE